MHFPGTHRQPGFIDLLCDAAFQLRMAIASQDSYMENRHSRASIMASTFTLECAANALMISLSLSSNLGEVMDRLPLLSKFDLYLKIQTQDLALDPGDARVSKVAELVRIRNAFVHPKVTHIDVELGELTDIGSAFSWPMEMAPKVWSTTKIPKPPLFWSRIHAESALDATTDFLAYFFNLAEAEPEKVKDLLFQRTHVTVGESSVTLESLFDEFTSELEWAAARGFKLGFLDFADTKKS